MPMDNHIVIMAGGIGSRFLAYEYTGMPKAVYRCDGMW